MGGIQATASPQPQQQSKFDCLLNACRLSGGTHILTDPSDFALLLREGASAHWGIKNAPFEEGQFKNQVTLGKNGSRLIFELYTQTPLKET
jgi:hypothetical protein